MDNQHGGGGNWSVQIAHKNPIAGGSPSVFFRRQLYHIWGTSWIHQKTVPIVPRTLDAGVASVDADMSGVMGDQLGYRRQATLGWLNGHSKGGMSRPEISVDHPFLPIARKNSMSLR